MPDSPDSPRTPRTRPVVALLGAPGSGKSTLAAALPPDTVLDLPGDPDLAGQVWDGLRRATAVLLVASPVQGLDPRTVQLFEACADLPRLVALTQLDRPGADADEAVALCQRLLGDQVLPLQLPLHDDDGTIGGLLDLLTLTVHADGERREADPEHVRLVEPLREDLLEALLTGSDGDAFDAWASGDQVAPGLLAAELPRAVSRGDLVPALVVRPSGLGPREAPYGQRPGQDPGLGLGPGLVELAGLLARLPNDAPHGDGPLAQPTPQLPVGVTPDAGLQARVAADPVARLAADPRSGQLLLWTVGPGHAEQLLAGAPSLPVRLEGPRTGRVLVRVPGWAVRAVRSDALGRGGEVLANQDHEEDAELELRLPASELVHYALALARVTASTGSFERLSGPLS